MTHQSNNSGSGFSFSQITRHEEFHINGGDLFFLVEHVQFRVHRYFFERESVVFRNQLMTPASPGASRQGTSESSAIILEDVRSRDFAKFLWVFYNPKYSLYHTSTDDWTVILDLAYRWQFPEVKSLVVRELERLELPDVNRISVYHKYGVDRNLLIPRYAALCEREEPLTLREGMLLGMETTLNIARAREYARANPTASGARSPTVAGIQHDEMHNLVRELFDVKPLDVPVDQDESPTTSSGGLARTQPPPQSRTEQPAKPPKGETAGPPMKPVTKSPTGKQPPKENQETAPPTTPTGSTAAQQKKQQKPKGKKATGQQAAATPTEATPSELPHQQEVPVAAPATGVAGETVVPDDAAKTQQRPCDGVAVGENRKVTGGIVDDGQKGDKEVDGKPEQESGSVENTATASESTLVDVGGAGEAAIGDVGKIGTPTVVPLKLNLDFFGEDDGLNKAFASAS